MTYTAVVTSKDIYDHDPEIPKGWRAIKFSPPRKGENFLPVVRYGSCYTPQSTTEDYLNLQPRIIVERIPIMKRYAIIVEEAEANASVANSARFTTQSSVFTLKGNTFYAPDINSGRRVRVIEVNEITTSGASCI